MSIAEDYGSVRFLRRRKIEDTIEINEEQISKQVMLDILFLDKFVGAGKILISEFQNDILRLV